MTPTACSILRHRTRPRYVGDLVAVLCETCDCIWFPEPIGPAPSIRPVAVPPSAATSGARRGADTPRAA